MKKTIILILAIALCGELFSQAPSTVRGFSGLTFRLRDSALVYQRQSYSYSPSDAPEYMKLWPVFKTSAGYVGIGTHTPSATLDVVGTFQYTDGNQSSGRVLTSDANGNATWAAGAGISPGEQGQIYQTSNSAAAWKYDTTTLVTFNAGANFAADTAAFTDSTIYGSFKLMGNDTFYVTGVSVVLYSNNAITDSLGIQITYNDTINVIGSHVFAATYGVNNGTTGQDADADDFTGSNSVPIPPGNWVWLKSPTVVAGRKPYYLSVSIIGYKKRVN